MSEILEYRTVGVPKIVGGEEEHAGSRDDQSDGEELLCIEIEFSFICHDFSQLSEPASHPFRSAFSYSHHI